MRTHQFIPETGAQGAGPAPLPSALSATGGVFASTACPRAAVAGGFLSVSLLPTPRHDQTKTRRGAVNPHGSASRFA